MVQTTPQGFHTVTPFFMASQPGKLLEFLKEAIGAEEVSVLRGENGEVWHAQVKLGDSMMMIGDAMGKPGVTQNLYVYCKDADAAYQRAMDAGAISIMKPDDQFYGDRNGGVKDPFGNIWWFATHIEDVEGEELERRARDFEKKVKAA